MRISFWTALIIILFFSCSPLSHLHKIQSDNRLSKTEVLNFSGEKARTQWWYFDCFLEDGSVLVFLFAPYQWWSEAEKMPSHKSLFYLSYMSAGGEVKIKNMVFDAQEVHYTDSSIICPYFELVKAHEKGARKYTVNFFLDDIKGSLKIRSGSKGFSPFPRGGMGPFLSKYILKLKGENSSFRYASHVTQGEVKGNMEVKGTCLDLSGKVYHEQGWFRGLPHEMGKGWSWFHFVSKKINIFGTPEEFFCLEKEGKRLIGGINILSKGCVLSNKVYADEPVKFLMGGSLDFASRILDFEVRSTGESTALICIPSFDTGQVWSTIAQPSSIRFKYKGKEFQEEGWLLIETCQMSKKTIHPLVRKKQNEMYR